MALGQETRRRLQISSYWHVSTEEKLQ